MLEFFTDFYPNEIIYSGIARNVFYEKDNVTSCNIRLFGKRTIGLEDFNGISHLANTLEGQYTIDYLLDKHTTLPYYLPFMCKTEQEKLLNGIYQGNRVRFSTGIGNSSDNKIKYCKKCVQEDVEKFGESYIHREHQLPGVLVCVKHGEILLPYGNFTRSDCSTKLIRLDSEKCLDEIMDKNIQVYDAEVMKYLKDYSVYASYILNVNLKEVSREQLVTEYKRLLKKKGLVSAIGKLDNTRLCKEFLGFYNSQILELFQCSLEGGEMRHKWVAQLVKGDGNINNPIKHILLMNFLEQNPKQFIDGLINQSDKINKEDKYTCYNKFCSSYMKPATGKYEFVAKYNKRYHNKYDIVVFTCASCGFSYSKPIDKEVKTRTPYIVRAYGGVWEEVLKKKLSEVKLNKTDVAEFMGCKVSIIERYEEMFEKNFPTDVLPITSTIKIDKFVYIKKCVEDMIKSNPKATRTEIYNMITSKYKMVLALDREGIEAVLPPCKKVTVINDDLKTNWEEKDKEFEQKIYDIYCKYKDVIPPVRMTIKLICEELDIKRSTMCGYYLVHMPRSNKLCDDIIETAGEYNLRRCKIAIKEMFNKGEEIKFNEIVRRTGVNRGYLRKVKIELQNYIKELKEGSTYT